MNTRLIQWASDLQRHLFHDGNSSGKVLACDNGTVKIDVENEPTMSIGPNPTDIKPLPGGRWYNWQTEGYFLCVRFREFLKANPFPQETQ